MLYKLLLDRPVIVLSLLLFPLFFSVDATAHVKWFAAYDVRDEPQSISDVLTKNFVLATVLSIIGIFIACLADRYLVGVNRFIEHRRSSALSQLGEGFEFRAIRYCLALFFTAVWVLGDVILTPELKHQSQWVSGVHILIVASLFHRKTAFLGGLGIFVLWLYGASVYGFFHLSDYMIFLGLASYVIIYSFYPDSSRKVWRYVVMYSAISFTLLWASIEKFVYPFWTYPILDESPYLLMTMPRESFMDVAGIVEFLMAFLLICVSGVSFLLAVLGLALVFILAIIDFGKIDAIGHFGIIASLLVMALHGPSRFNLWFSNLHKAPVVNATYTTLIYTALLGVFFTLYYSIRNVWLFFAS